MNYNRQLDIFNPEKFNEEVHIVGCGATGSWAAMSLAKMGVPKIHLWDFDIVEEHNIPNQLFPMNAIGVNKAQALSELIEQCSPDTECIVHQEKATSETVFRGYVFMLTDTMSSRSNIFRLAIKNNFAVKRLIETRMGGDNFRVYSINPCNRAHCEKYAKTLYDDDVAETSVCGTAKSIATTACIVANYAVWQMIKSLDYEMEDNGNEIIADLRYNNVLTSDYK